MSSERSTPVRILVVDDDAGIRGVVRAMLESVGFAVDLAANGREAIDMLGSDRYDVVITDLVMPEQEGITTIKEIRRFHPSLKVIAMSGAFGGDYLRIAEYLGAHGTLAKPLRLEAVLNAIYSVLEQE